MWKNRKERNRICCFLVAMICLLSWGFAGKAANATLEQFSFYSTTWVRQASVITDGASDWQVEHKLTILEGQQFSLAQVSNLSDFSKTGGAYSITVYERDDQEPTEVVSMGAVSVEKVSVEPGEQVVRIQDDSIVQALKKGQSWLQVSARIDGQVLETVLQVEVVTPDEVPSGTVMHQLYQKLAALHPEQAVTSDKLVTLYQDYDSTRRACQSFDGFERAHQILQDSQDNFWGITNADGLSLQKLSFTNYFEQNKIAVKGVEEISEYEGLQVTLSRAVSVDDVIGYLFYHDFSYEQQQQIPLTLRTVDQNGKEFCNQTLTWSVGEDVKVLPWNAEAIHNGSQQLYFRGIDGSETVFTYSFVKKYTAEQKGCYVKKTHSVYDSSRKGKKVGSCKKGIRYQVLAVSSATGWARIQLPEGTIGYIQKKYLTAKNTAATYVNIKDAKYSYSDMVKDIKKLDTSYQSILKVSVLTTTADQRKVYCFCLGNPDATKKIVVDSTLHAREWLNSQMMMHMVEDYCRGYDTKKYEGVAWKKLYQSVCIYVLPMMNPDGVSISQFGLKGVRNASLRARVKKIGRGYYRNWKSNARGVDLNRNYNPGFRHNSTKHPSYMGYGGKEPLSEKESRALVNLVNQVKPVAVVNYHEAGKMIYYTTNSGMLQKTKKMTGYMADGSASAPHGTFGDWLDARKITWCTLETCYGVAPVGHWQYNDTYRRNKDMFLMLAKHYK